jgi:hypothetical protein
MVPVGSRTKIFYFFFFFFFLADYGVCVSGNDLVAKKKNMQERQKNCLSSSIEKQIANGFRAHWKTQGWAFSGRMEESSVII